MTPKPTAQASMIDSSQIPDDLARNLVHEYLDALNAGDRDAMREVIRTHFAPSFLVRFPSELYLSVLVSMQMGAYYATAGQGYELYGDPRSEGGEVCTVLYNKLTESWADLCFPLAPDPPHQVSGMVELKPAPSPPGAQLPGALSDAEMVARLEMCLDGMVEDEAKTLWISEARDWKAIDGQTTMAVGAVTWFDEGTPWAVFNVEELVYNADVSEYVRAAGP